MRLSQQRIADSALEKRRVQASCTSAHINYSGAQPGTVTGSVDRQLPAAGGGMVKASAAVGVGDVRMSAMAATAATTASPAANSVRRGLYCR